MTGLGFYGTDGLELTTDADVSGLLTTDRSTELGRPSERRKPADPAARQRRLAAFSSGEVHAATVGIGDRLGLYLRSGDSTGWGENAL